MLYLIRQRRPQFQLEQVLEHQVQARLLFDERERLLLRERAKEALHEHELAQANLANLYPIQLTEPRRAAAARMHVVDRDQLAVVGVDDANVVAVRNPQVAQRSDGVQLLLGAIVPSNLPGHVASPFQ